MIIDIGLFPGSSHLVNAKRAPILYRPFIGSQEQYVVGAVAFTSSEVHIERANKLDKLNCLFGEQAKGVLWAIEIALDHLSETIEVDQDTFELIYEPAVSAISVGVAHEAQGQNLNLVASNWLAAMSSFYLSDQLGASIKLPTIVDTIEAEIGQASERLPSLVLQYVLSKQPNVVGAFSRDIQDGKQRRKAGAHGIIDFSGRKLVANFSTLKPQGFSSSIDRIKRRMWDLKIDKDGEGQCLIGRNTARLHEMFIQHPPENDPQLTQSQVDKIFTSLTELERQADQEEIRLRPMTTVEQIGNHLLLSEAA